MYVKMGFPDCTGVKNLPFSVEEARDSSSVPGLGRSPGEGNNCPFQYSCLEKSWTEDPCGLHSMGQQRGGPYGHTPTEKCRMMLSSEHSHGC